MIKDKNIVFCLTGGIACYKAVDLISKLVKAGANVYPVVTKSALEFITPLTLKTISKKKVTTDLFDTSDFIPHISLSDLADLVIVAPATANIISKAANGIADDMVSTLLLSVTAPKIIVPAMNTKMIENPIIVKNIEKLIEYGFNVLDSDSGMMACGTSGKGRYPDNERIFGAIIETFVDRESVFYNKDILITLGGTIEDIDPVRSIANRSSGKMGFAFAREFIERGAKVTLICGNCSELEKDRFQKRFPNIKLISVRSAKKMKAEIDKTEYDILFMAAAVADFYVKYNEQKIKKSDNLNLQLNKNIDILNSIEKRTDRIYIGFAAESENLTEAAKKKLADKKLDFIIANNIVGTESAMGGDRAKITLLNRFNDLEYNFGYDDKSTIAKMTLDTIELYIIDSFKE